MNNFLNAIDSPPGGQPSVAGVDVDLDDAAAADDVQIGAHLLVAVD